MTHPEGEALVKRGTLTIGLMSAVLMLYGACATATPTPFIPVPPAMLLPVPSVTPIPTALPELPSIAGWIEWPEGNQYDLRALADNVRKDEADIGAFLTLVCGGAAWPSQVEVYWGGEWAYDEEQDGHLRPLGYEVDGTKREREWVMKVGSLLYYDVQGFVDDVRGARSLRIDDGIRWAEWNLDGTEEVVHRLACVE